MSLSVYTIQPEPDLKSEVAVFLHRKRHAPPHVHHCPGCYEHEPCGMDCAIERDLGEHKGMPQGYHTLCSRCAPHLCSGCLEIRAACTCGKDEDDLIFAIYEANDRAFREGRFHDVDAALHGLDVAGMPLVLLAAWLSSTCVARHRLPYWQTLAEASRERVSWVGDYLNAPVGP